MTQSGAVMEILLLFCLTLPLVYGAAVDPTPKQLYILQTDYFPAFCFVLENRLLGPDPDNPVYDLAITSFSAAPRQTDHVVRIEGVSKKYLDSTQMVGTTITDELSWPNEVALVPDHMFALPFVWSVSSGFFMPGKDDGEIALMSMTDITYGKANPVEISTSGDGLLWYYHRVEWVDMNGDGYLDALSERANGGGPAANASQLVWFENPKTSQLKPNWEVRVLSEHKEDVYFRVVEIPHPDGGMSTVIISSGFYSNMLTAVWSEGNNWIDMSTVKTLVVDTYGWYFDVEVVDVNMDGKLDVLTSTWSQQGKPGAVIVYEIPDEDWRSDPWTRHVLQDGYHTSVLPGLGSPGTAQSFRPSAEMSSNKPYIMVSGDDDGHAYVLTPDSESTDDWSYTQQAIYKGSGTAGGIAVKDVDGDGFAEVFIPSYTAKQIVVMSYRPDGP